MYTQLHDERNELIAMNPDGSKKRVVLTGKEFFFPNKVDWGTHP